MLFRSLYNLRFVEPNTRGILVYPKEKKREKIILNDEILKEMENILSGILEVSNLTSPPFAEKKPYCKGCSFYELCMV